MKGVFFGQNVLFPLIHVLNHWNKPLETSESFKLTEEKKKPKEK